MGFLSINNEVTVNCKKNYENDIRFTLVDNKKRDAHDFKTGTEMLKYIKDMFGIMVVDSYVDKLVEKRFNEEKENRKWKTYTFFLKKSEAPYIINKIDSSEHIKSWKISDDDTFESEGMVMITYEADKQILNQTIDGVVIEL